jgi:hypothetical protein
VYIDGLLGRLLIQGHFVAYVILIVVDRKPADDFLFQVVHERLRFVKSSLERISSSSCCSELIIS